MTKLQLYISQSLRGYKNLVNINPSEDVYRLIHDYRGALEKIKYDSDTPQEFFLLSYTDAGVLFTAIRTLPPVAHDHTAATVFFPRGVMIEPEEMNRIITTVSATIATGKAPDADTLAALRTLLSKEYPVDAAAPLRLPSTGRHYAVSRFGGKAPSLHDYLDLSRYTPAFSGYAGVLLLPDTSAAKPADVPDITPRELVHAVAINPPAATAQGFEPHIFKRPFRHSYLVPVDSDIEITWHRSGFDPVVQKVHVTEKGATIPAPDTRLATKVVTPSSFYITEQGSQRSLGAYMIKVNGREIDGPETFTFEELRDAKVEISSPGYFAYSGRLDLASTAQALVQMRQLHRTYRFDLPLHTPEPIEAIRIYLKTRKPITECPIEGYSVAGDGIVEGSGVTNNLVYTGGGRRRLKLGIACAVTGLLLGLLIGWLAFGGSKSQPEVVHTIPQSEALVAPQQPVAEPAEAIDDSIQAETPEEPAAQAAEATAPDYAAAAAYLDDNRVWTRSDMEAIPALAGLFDAINTYDFPTITSRWSNTPLADSRSFGALLRAIENSKSKRDPRTGDHTPAYNSPGDEAITWLAYTYWIDP